MFEEIKIVLRGGCFGISLELGPAGDDQHASKILSALWSYPAIKGPWRNRNDVHYNSALSEDVARIATGYGNLFISSTEHISFSAHIIREVFKNERGGRPPFVNFGSWTPEVSDWLTIDLAVQDLADIWNVDDSWCIEGQPWLENVCLALANIADHINSRAEIMGGVIGHETSGCWRAPSPERLKNCSNESGYVAVLNSKIIDDRGGFVVPDELWNHLAPNATPTAFSNGLLYIAPVRNAELTADGYYDLNH